MRELILRNATVLDLEGREVKKDIFISNGIIDDIKNALQPELIENVDVSGMHVFPGFIDLNCDVCEPGYEYREDIATVSRSGVKGGYTSITCLPTTMPCIDNKTVVSYIKSASQTRAKVNIFPYGSMTQSGAGEKIAEIGEMHKAGIVGISDGNTSVLDADLLRNIMLYSTMLDLPVITFCENKFLARDGVINYGRVSTITGLSGNPREAEETFIARNLILAMHTKARLHITHVTTKGSVEMIRIAKSKGINVTCDTCPHYFILSEGAAENYNTYAKVKPPLRTEEDIEGIKKGLADGTIDAIASGHSPTTIEGKRMEFARATQGISSIETAFALSYTHLVKPGWLTLKQLIDKFSCIPARILKLNDKGGIEEGLDADFTVIDLNKSYKINPKEFASKAKFSPYENYEVTGEIVYTLVNGEIVYLK